MKVIVTGANGFIGIHTFRRPLEKGYKVTALHIKTERLKTSTTNTAKSKRWKFSARTLAFRTEIERSQQHSRYGEKH